MRPEKKDELVDASLHLKAVIDSMADPVIVVRPDYRVVLVNETARRHFAQAGGGSTPFLCHQVSHRSDEPCRGSEHPCPMKGARDSGKPVKVLHEHYDKDNERRFVEITASPLWEDDGHFGGIVESQRDVTDRVFAENRLADYASRLETSNRLKDLFIDILRHDLVNPAWYVLTAATAALRKEEDPSLRSDLQGITRVSRKIVDLIQNASILAKLEEDRDLSFEDVDLREMMETAMKEHEAAGQERQVTLELNAPDPCMVRGNPLLGDVFSNLVGNAVKYGGENSTVEIAIADDDSEGTVAVADRGGGVSDEDKESIFTRFTRRDKEGVQGSGLGLSIVRRIVEAHKGKVWVEDRPGGGSVFVVKIPRRGGASPPPSKSGKH
jgi:signal transduction histidine kinase